jgi:hypothetical protein
VGDVFDRDLRDRIDDHVAVLHPVTMPILTCGCVRRERCT